MKSVIDQNRTNVSRRWFVARAVTVPLACLTAGCASVQLPGQGPPPRLFRLTPKSTFDRLPEAKWQLAVELPVAPTGLDTSRIALQRTPTTFEYYARASWTDRAPAMVQTLIIESFQNSERVAAGRAAAGLRADFVLRTELREFQAEYSALGPPQAHVWIDATLVSSPNRIIVGTHHVDHVVDTAADRMAAIVETFDQALGKC